MTDVPSSWSRRRAAVAAEAAAEELAAQEAVVRSEQAALAEKTDEEILEELGLPDPESLGMGDDFKGFLSKKVPQRLRQRALRQLWRSNPVLACVDGLNDYDDDYLAAGLGQGAIKTTYQVGKGMLAHLLEVERLKNAGPDAPAVEDADAEDVVMEDTADTAEAKDESSVTAPHAAYTSSPDAQADDETRPHARARMQFQFEEGTA